MCTGCFVDRPERPEHGSRSRAGTTGRDFGDPRACLHRYTTDGAHRSIGYTGYVSTLRLWARVLFDSGASHSFIAAFCVNVLGLKVESLEKPLHVSFPLGIRVRIDKICRDCE